MKVGRTPGWNTCDITFLYEDDARTVIVEPWGVLPEGAADLELKLAYHSFYYRNSRVVKCG